MQIKNFKAPSFLPVIKTKLPIFFASILVVLSIVFIFFISSSQTAIKDASIKNADLEKKIKNLSSELSKLKNQDQYKANQELKTNINNIENTYKESLGIYNRMADLRAQNVKTADFEKQFAKVLNYLSTLNYSSASADLKLLSENIKKSEDSLVQAEIAQIANVAVNNSAPGAGFSQQKVETERGEFLVSLVAADLNSTRVLVDTASDGDCRNNCPVLPLATYVSRSGGFAGINGSYFCPPDYPSCAGKVNSFDTLLMNKNKVYFNSDNNVYSNVPLVYFTGNTMGVRGRSSDWGRDTGVDSVIAMQTLLVSGGNPTGAVGIRGAKTFIGARGNMVYIGVVYNATFNEAGIVLKTMGIDNALNLDQGGSTALWYGGYKAGPGRNLPNAVVFVRK
ncbi:MAG: hypothetical protein A2958_01135 [Candidatus Levybacteria bacterium RIFCSPLOWO2_01_FULL_38_13]|nr:MAG: hypothetical protein A2629_00995 [Candidatus Levybacteria bacterium RIFCSPHIGHO2_01_FULL_41_15]OGH35758.1 MAG: hypothetical protein A2958_01135 [Candidatus Levybacteria bacterium RIFCSPLOWO2_01_FULL_38_13]